MQTIKCPYCGKEVTYETDVGRLAQVQFYLDHEPCRLKNAHIYATSIVCANEPQNDWDIELINNKEEV